MLPNVPNREVSKFQGRREAVMKQFRFLMYTLPMACSVRMSAFFIRELEYMKSCEGLQN